MVKFGKILLLVCIVFVLFVPILQQNIKISLEQDFLNGYYVPARDTVLNSKTWFERVYQEKMDNYVNENFGFRKLLVKLDNQINYTVNGNFNVKHLLSAKENYLFDKKFIDEFTGRSYRGKAHIDSVVTDLSRLNDSLKAKGKKLLICFAPCKESFYPEYLPDSIRISNETISNYTQYKKEFERKKISLLDYNVLFKQMKDTVSYPLFNQGGVHWTTYGTYLALDTLLKRITYETKKRTNSIRFKTIEISETARYADDDIVKAMNIYQNINSGKLAYPTVEFTLHPDSCDKPKVIIVGDSFYYGLNNTWLPLSTFSQESYFLYYFQQVIPYDIKKDGMQMQALDFKKELKNTDLVILFFSIGNLNQFPYGAASMID